MFELLLRFVRSARREANWALTVESLKEMLVWFWAYDRTNYQRYLPVYILMTSNLSKTHPDAYESLVNGAGGLFTIQRSFGNRFGRIPIDQTVESTVNCDTKTRGGISGFSCTILSKLCSNGHYCTLIGLNIVNSVIN